MRPTPPCCIASRTCPALGSPPGPARRASRLCRTTRAPRRLTRADRRCAPPSLRRPLRSPAGGAGTAACHRPAERRSSIDLRSAEYGSGSGVPIGYGRLWTGASGRSKPTSAWIHASICSRASCTITIEIVSDNLPQLRSPAPGSRACSRSIETGPAERAERTSRSNTRDSSRSSLRVPTPSSRIRMTEAGSTSTEPS